MINLLPPSYKAELERQQSLRLSVVLALSMMIALLCFSLVLFAAKIYVASKAQANLIILEYQKQELAKKTVVAQQMISFNTTTEQLNAFYAHRLSPSLAFDRIAAHLPERIHLASFSYTAPTVVTVGEAKQIQPPKISVSGFSSTRDSLFQFRERIDKDPLFRDASFPPIDWISPVDINFSFSAALDFQHQ